MPAIDYNHADFPIRNDFAKAHNRYWKRLASPGAWFTGEQRIAIAKEVRQASRCSLCSRRKAALSAGSVDGAHDTVSDLPDAVVEVVHRVITDSGRLSKTWFDGVIQQGLTVEQYVEVIGTVVNLLSIDEFCRGMGIALNELPEALAGDPSHYRPATIVEDGDGSWVPMCPNIVDSGPESDLWQGRTGYVLRALSLVPDEVRTMMDLLETHYISGAQIWNVKHCPRGTLSRIQMEVIATRVSSYNDCFY